MAAKGADVRGGGDRFSQVATSWPLGDSLPNGFLNRGEMASSPGGGRETIGHTVGDPPKVIDM